MKTQHTKKLKKLVEQLNSINHLKSQTPVIEFTEKALQRIEDIENEPAEGFTIQRLAAIGVFISNHAYGPVKMPNYTKKLTEEYN